jgi:hypothetical protein
MSQEQTSLMASNSQQTKQSQTPQPQANMTPEQEHNTRVMACDIQRFYDFVRRYKRVSRRWFTHYEINLARFLEPHCTLFENERKWPETWLENEQDLINDLKAFRPKAKQLLQQWIRAVAVQILGVQNTALSKIFTPEDVALAAKLEPTPSLGHKVGPLDWTQRERDFDRSLSKFRFLANDMLQELKGGPTLERPGHPWTRMKGFDVLNFMIKDAEEPQYENEEEYMWDDEIVPFYGFY